MIKIGDVIIRNIQEQVAKNKADVAALRNVETILNQYGITVLGRVDEDTDIPETKPGGGDYVYGDAWLVGTTTPYDMYIWTRTDDPDVGEFINIGPISMVGPQGPQGEQGPSGTIAIGTVSTGLPGSSASVENVGTSENAIFNFIIPQGAKGETGSQGERGLTGEAGPIGLTGPQGPQGDPGQSFMIIGVITNTSQLPDPTTTQRNYAYVYNDGDASTPDRLYYIIGDPGEETWTYSSLAAAGTTVYVNGNPVSTFDADTKVNAPSSAGTVGDVLTLGSSGPEWTTPSSGGGADLLWSGEAAGSSGVNVSALAHPITDYKILYITGYSYNIGLKSYKWSAFINAAIVSSSSNYTMAVARYTDAGGTKGMYGFVIDCSTSKIKITSEFANIVLAGTARAFNANEQYIEAIYGIK